MTRGRARPKIASPADERRRVAFVQVDVPRADERLARAFELLLEAGRSAERMPITSAPSRQEAAATHQVLAAAGLPNDATLNAAIAAAHLEPTAPLPRTATAKPRKPRAVTAPVTPPRSTNGAAGDVDTTTPREEPPTMATKEKVCKLCLRKAPEKCKRHGGASGKSQRVKSGAGKRRASAALARMDAGTWGKCLSCGEAIAEKRLIAMPEVEHCITCAEALELLATRDDVPAAWDRDEE